MTIDEAIMYLKKADVSVGCEVKTKTADAIEMAIKALEQEPCGDVISRQELLKAISTWDKFGCDADTKLVPYKDHYVPYIHYDDVINCIKGMPPVTPQPKMGRWVKHDTGHSKYYYDCSLCGCVAPCTEFCDCFVWKLSAYCPDCGAKMKGAKNNVE